MKQIDVDVSKSLHEIGFPKMLHKDLQDDERICPHCKGTGIAIRDNIYGIKGDTSEIAKHNHFPYKHQSITFCQHCFNGVQMLCEYCGKPFKNQSYHVCDCDEFKAEEERKKKKKYEETIKNAHMIDEANLSGDYMLYCEEDGNFYEDSESFLDEYAHDEEFCKQVNILWVCERHEISIDAESIAENACEELHEDAYEQCDIVELQKLLDKWCKDQKGTTTYYPCYKEYVFVF